jgi:DNA-directed RNA polymerase I, II, and III subunit RPABC2
MILDFQDINHVYDPSKNKTSNILTKYEKVKMLGLRAEQIQRGSTVYIDMTTVPIFNALVIAKLELNQKKLPFMINRKLPNGESEYWKLEDMIIL